MVKFFTLLLAVIGLMLLGIGLILAREYPAMWVCVFAGVAITYGAYIMDNRHEKYIKKLHGKNTKLRIEALEKLPWENEKFLEVKTGNANILFVSLTLAASLLFNYYCASASYPQWGGVFIGGYYSQSSYYLFYLEYFPAPGSQH